MKSLNSALMISMAVLGCDRPTTAPPTRASSAASAALNTAVPAASASSAASTAPLASTGNAPNNERVVAFDTEPVGAASPEFEGVVGDWYVAEVGGAHGLEVDGGKWRNGTPSANLADQAKHLYGDRYAEFLDGVKAFAFFPFAVFKADPPAGDLRISVRFFPMAGKVDQAAGIAFAIAPDGTYLGVRVNALEDNLLYFRVVKGKRTIIDDVRDVPTPSKVWHTFALELRGKALTATLDGQKRFEKTLDAVPRGRIGLWSKADSQVLFDDFKVEVLNGPSPTQPTPR